MRYAAIFVVLFVTLTALMWGVAGFIAMSWNVFVWGGLARFGLAFFCFVVVLPISAMLTVGVHESDESKAKKSKATGK